MSIRRFRVVAPSGAPLPLRAVLSSALRVRGDRSGLVNLLRHRLGVRHVFLVSSGRAALTLLVKALQRVSDRREVVIPAYTCFSVASAVVRAGLVVRLCDVDPKTFDLDHNALLRLDLEKVLCIIPSGLYGMPADLVTLERIARASGAFLIDDAAQCLGAAVDNMPCGTFGDAGFYSLGRGKNITTMGGGIVVSHNEDLAQLIAQEWRKVPRPSARASCSSMVGSLFYSGMLRPSRYWLPNRIPFLGLGISRFDPSFEIAQLSAFQTRLVTRLLPLVDTYNRIGRNNADQLRARIEGVEGIEIPRPATRADPVYLRFPILARDGRHRSRLLRRLRAAGIAATTSYPSGIGDIPGIEPYLACDQQPCPQAQAIATRIITLPTHVYVTSDDIGQMVEVVRAESK